MNALTHIFTNQQFQILGAELGFERAQAKQLIYPENSALEVTVRGLFPGSFLCLLSELWTPRLCCRYAGCTFSFTKDGMDAPGLPAHWDTEEKHPHNTMAVASASE